MQDAYFLDWQVSAGDRVEPLQQIGHIETSKAVSDLFAPVARHRRLQPGVAGRPLRDQRGQPRRRLAVRDGIAGRGLVSAAEYHQFLTDNWEKTQRMIKARSTPKTEGRP